MEHLGDPDDLTHVHGVVVGHVQQHLGERRHLASLIGGLHHPRRIEPVQHALGHAQRLLPDLEQSRLRIPVSRRELCVAVPTGVAATDHLIEVVAIRPGQVQDQVRGGVRLLMWPPPEIVVTQHVETRVDLSRVIV